MVNRDVIKNHGETSSISDGAPDTNDGNEDIVENPVQAVAANEPAPDPSNIIDNNTTHRGSFASIVNRLQPNSFSQQKRSPLLNPSTKKKSDVVFGTLKSASDLKTVKFHKINKRNDNRHCIGVFISRLQPHVQTIDINRHVKKMTKLNVHSIKLKPKFDTYSSFLIQSSGHVIQKLLDSDVWPEGTLVRKYFD